MVIYRGADQTATAMVWTAATADAVGRTLREEEVGWKRVRRGGAASGTVTAGVVCGANIFQNQGERDARNIDGILGKK